MAYPFAPRITVGDFIARLRAERDCEIEISTRNLNGQALSCRTIVRVVDGVRTHVPIDCEDGMTLNPTVLRSICARLRIDPIMFGFEIR